jgi:hypothetical protein
MIENQDTNGPSLNRDAVLATWKFVSWFVMCFRGQWPLSIYAVSWWLLLGPGQGPAPISTSGILTTWTGFGKTVQTCLNHVQTCLSRYRNVKPVYTWYVHVYTMYIQICNCTYVSVQIWNYCPFHVHRQEFTYMYVHSTDMSVHLPLLNTDLTASSLLLLLDHCCMHHFSTVSSSGRLRYYDIIVSLWYHSFTMISQFELLNCDIIDHIIAMIS